MTEHVNHDDLAALACGLADSQLRRHIAACAECAAKVDSLQAALGGFAAAARAESEMPESHWARQRSRIALNVASRNHRAAMWQWAAATTALFVVAVSLVVASPKIKRPPASPHAATAQAPSDPDAVLQAVAEDLQRDTPEALAPAALLVEEHNRIEALAAARSASQGEKND